MNVVESLEYLKAGLLKAGLKPHQVLTAMELAKPNNSDSVPSASIFALESRLSRQSGKVRITAVEVVPPVDGAVGGLRKTVMGGLTWFEVQVSHNSMAAMQNTLAQFFEYIITTPLIDRAGNKYRLLADGDASQRDREIQIVWQDHDQADRVRCSFQLPIPGVIWHDHPLIPIEIIVQYRLEGGNPDE